MLNPTPTPTPSPFPASVPTPLPRPLVGGPAPGDETPRTIVIAHATSDGTVELSKLLTHPLIKIHAAGNGVEAVALVRRVRPSLVVLDTSLPGMDGFEVFRSLKKELEGMPARAILVSDRAEQGALAMARDCGVYACFRVPFTATRLRERVLEALALPPESKSVKLTARAGPPPASPGTHRGPPAV